MTSSRVSTALMKTGATRRFGREPPPAPVVLERYRLARRLGAGAFGTVWMARDERLDRAVAVKILARERIVGGRFEREARAAARLAHPGIVTLYEAAVDDEGAYLVSELVIGDTLDALVAAGRLSDRDIVAIAIALCDALEHAHLQGVVHRDVKPSNVLVPEAPASAAQVAKLTDFGVARVIDGDSLTVTGDVLGTLAYMAPEQAAGCEAGPSADLFSLALVIYEALTGVNPVALSSAARRARRLGAHLPALRRQRRDLPRELGAGIDLALRPRPDERGSLTDLRRALKAAEVRVGDEPGIVAGPWTPRNHASAPDAGENFAAAPDGARDTSLRGPGALGAPGGAGAGHESLRPRAGASAEPPEPLAASDAPPAVDAWPARATGAVLAGALSAWLDAVVLSSSPAPPAVAGLVAAGAILLAPRLGWALVVTALCALAAAAHHPGAAVAIAIAGLMPVALLPARPTAWPLAAGAPVLGMIGLAGAWPALAAQAATTWRRAVLGAVGWAWLLVAGSLSGRILYLPQLPGAPPPGTWTGSLSVTIDPLLVTFVSAGVLAPAVVWGAGAAALPWLARGRSPAMDLMRVLVWAVLLAGATPACISAVSGSDRLGTPPGLVLGAVASVFVALAPTAWRAWRRALRSPGSGVRVS